MNSLARVLVALGLVMISFHYVRSEAIGQTTVAGMSTAVQPSDQRAQLEIQLGVSSFATNATAAQAANQLDVQRVIRAVAQSGVQIDEVESGRIVLVPEYARPDPVPLRGFREEPRIVGYRAIGEVIVRTRDTARLGLLLDTAAAAGANQVAPVEPG